MCQPYTRYFNFYEVKADLMSYFHNIFPQRQLGDMKQSSQLRIQLREKEAQELRQAIFSLTVSANALLGLI